MHGPREKVLIVCRYAISFHQQAESNQVVAIEGILRARNKRKKLKETQEVLRSAVNTVSMKAV
jgi:hypothetical protein